MPPLPLEYTGRTAIAAFLDHRAEVRGAPLGLRRHARTASLRSAAICTPARGACSR